VEELENEQGMTSVLQEGFGCLYIVLEAV
jgi:hypothetical protein